MLEPNITLWHAEKPSFIYYADNYPFTEADVQQIPIADFEAKVAKQRGLSHFT